MTWHDHVWRPVTQPSKIPPTLVLRSPSIVWVDDPVDDPDVLRVVAATAVATRHHYLISTLHPDLLAASFADPVFWSRVDATVSWLCGIEPGDIDSPSGVRALGRRIRESRDRLGIAEQATWPLRNLWIGARIEGNGGNTSRLEAVAEIPAHRRWVDARNLTSPFQPSYMTLQAFDWVLAGGDPDAVTALVEGPVEGAARSNAVEVVDLARGHTVGFSNNAELHLGLYDDVEARVGPKAWAWVSGGPKVAPYQVLEEADRLPSIVSFAESLAL